MRDDPPFRARETEHLAVVAGELAADPFGHDRKLIGQEIVQNEGGIGIHAQGLGETGAIRKHV